MRLKLDARVYSVEAVREAAEAFQEWASFIVSKAGKDIRVEARPAGGPLGAGFEDEFCNYVLGAMRS